MDNEVQKEIHKGMIALIDSQSERIEVIVNAIDKLQEAMAYLLKMTEHNGKVGDLNIKAIGDIFEQLKQIEDGQ